MCEQLQELARTNNLFSQDWAIACVSFSQKVVTPKASSEPMLIVRLSFNMYSHLGVLRQYSYSPFDRRLSTSYPDLDLVFA